MFKPVFRRDFQHIMKHCAYCGKENDDAAVYCQECGTDGFKESAPADKAAASVEPGPESVEPEAELASPESELGSAGLEFLTPTPREMAGDVVNLLTCRTLGEADMLVARLETAGIPAFIPDQFLMQNIGFNLNTFGYVRIQVSPKDYEAAKELLSGTGQDA
jgi:hypothetical protein